MKRRDFLRKSFGVSIASGTILSTTGFTSIVNGKGNNEGNFDLVAVKGGEPDDTTAVKIFGIELNRVKHISMAEELGV